MLHKEIAGLSVLFFLLWIFVASSGGERIQRVCAPLDWTSNIVLSAAALASPDSQHSLAKGADKVVYGCEYIVWRLFYQSGFDEWNRQRQARMLDVPQPEANPDAEAPDKEPSEQAAEGDSAAASKQAAETAPKATPEAPSAATPYVPADKGAHVTRIIE